MRHRATVSVMLAVAGILGRGRAAGSCPVLYLAAGAHFAISVAAYGGGARLSRGLGVVRIAARKTSGLADGPDFVPRQVTRYSGDSGQPIASLRLSPDGKLVVYARGTELNAQSRSANPTSEGHPAQAAGVGAADATAPGRRAPPARRDGLRV